MAYFEVSFQTFVVLIEHKFMLVTTHSARKMFPDHMFGKLLFIIEVFIAELNQFNYLTVRMEKYQIPVLVIIPVFKMFVQPILTI